MNKHKNIPIFVPHEGCPNDCVFCNQRKISGKTRFDPDTVPYEIERSLATLDKNATAEIAFFGGSFTGIEQGLMIRLLSIASDYVEKGRVQSVRLSTRPDFINEKILDILSQYHVKTIEIGFQSLDDDVLKLSRRGHTSQDSFNAARLIKNYGFELIGQMMTGLPGSDVDKEVYTARKICEMGANGARIYPTVVFYDTVLCEMAKNGQYQPLTLEQSVDGAYRAYKVFLENGVEVIRCGLCAADNLFEENTVYSGGYHEALGELVQSRIFYDEIVRKLPEPPFSSIEISVPVGMSSRAAGHKKINKEKLLSKYNIQNITIKETQSLKGFEVEIKRKD